MTEVMPFYGDKYEQLASIAPEVEAAGMFVTGMTSIDQAMIDGELYANSMASIEDADLFPDGIDLSHFRPSQDMIDHLLEEGQRQSREFGGGPVILRSSGRGDSTGNGVYESERYDLTPDRAADAFKIVVGSYFDKKGRIFRERAGLEPGFAVFIQPLVGNVVDGRYDESYGVLRNPRKDPKLFRTDYSGNARLATPLHPTGAIKIQRGLGSAVAIPGLPSVDFDLTDCDDESPENAMFELAERSMSHRTMRDADRAFSKQGYVLDADGNWTSNYGDYRPVAYMGDEGVTLGGLKQLLLNLNNSLGSAPSYYEFASRWHEGEERIYIIQKGAIANNGPEVNLETIDRRQVLIDGVTVEAGNGACPSFETIVCLTDNDKQDLYAFDKSKAAKGGYLLAYHASRAMRGHEIDMRQLSNVRAFMAFESGDWGHSKRPEEHVLGYSDQLGIPLMTIMSGGDAWPLLTGYDPYEREPSAPRQGSLIVRSGKFQVMTGSATDQALILDLDKA